VRALVLQHPLLGIADRELPLDHFVGQHQLRGAVDAEQRARVAHVEIASEQQRLHRLGQVEQAQQVGSGAARAADRLGGSLVRIGELVDQASDGLCFLERIEVFALDVLDQRHRERLLVGHLAHDDRHLVETSQLRRPVAPFTGHDLVALVGQRPNEDGLHHAMQTDGVGELLQRALVHAGARLIAARLQALDGQRGHGRRRAGAGGHREIGAEQRLETSAQALGLGRRGRATAGGRGIGHAGRLRRRSTSSAANST
jgi:hypothetical protein